MKIITLPIEESSHIKKSLSHKIGEPGSERNHHNAIELPSEITSPSVRIKCFAAYCKQWLKLILGFTTKDTASSRSLSTGVGNMKAVKESDTDETMSFDSSFNTAISKGANVKFNHLFPLKASDEKSAGAGSLHDTRKKDQRLRTGIYTQRDKDRKTVEPHRLKAEETSKPKHSEAGALLAETEQIARIGSWEYTVEAHNFFCTDFVYTLLRIPTKKTVSSFLSFLQYFIEEDRPKLTHGWSQALSNGKALNCVTRLGHLQENTWVRVIMKPVYKDNRLLKVIGTLQDVTDCIETQMQLLAEKEKAEQSTKAKSEFVSLMSHEIRTPLNAIMGHTYLLLQEENVAQEHKENLQSIHFSSQNMLTLINNTLDFSRIEAGKIELEKVNFQLTDLLKKIIRALSTRASEKHLNLVLNLGEDTPSEVAGDPARLTQILNNLISNAIKFTISGSVTLSVEVVYQSNDDWVLEFMVTDTGVGIPVDKQQKIFESFVQASAATHRQYGGSGLGLAITKKIVELQNGSIHLISTPGAGSEFAVRLRFLKPDISLESLKAIEPAQKSASTLKDAKVLVIDDNIFNNMVASKLLISWQAEVDTAGDGFAAIEKMKTTAYDLVLMDLHMPVMNGFEAMAEIRSLGYTLPIIALTANACEDEKKIILALGGNDYITKPFAPQELQDKMLKHLQPMCY
ncbi:ATP-binding protein [Pontibacter pamirensis]|uniref:ATP-binding protein n=1 Tax=Pontibacter pamirensis TaxID=2562824 RepID=UPI0013893D3D|nr:ATP-binding protein [Pontibacter pamirensis]